MADEADDNDESIVTKVKFVELLISNLTARLLFSPEKTHF